MGLLICGKKRKEGKQGGKHKDMTRLERMRDHCPCQQESEHAAEHAGTGAQQHVGIVQFHHHIDRKGCDAQPDSQREPSLLQRNRQ